MTHGAPWTEREVALLRERRAAGDPAKRIARLLGRTKAAVEHKAQEVAPLLQRRRPGDREAAASQLCGRVPDSEIARRLGCATATIAYHRRKLKLAGVGRGCRNPAHLRRERQAFMDRQKAANARKGWPVGCTDRIAVVLAQVEAGVNTIAGIAAAIVRGRAAVQKALHDAQRLGWVAKEYAGKDRVVYSLTQPVMDRRGRDTPGLIVCFNCNDIAPHNQIGKVGWISRRIRGFEKVNIREVLCDQCKPGGVNGRAGEAGRQGGGAGSCTPPQAGRGVGRVLRPAAGAAHALVG